MDGIKVPEEQVIPMNSIAYGVQGLRVTFVNVFALIHADESWTLIDTAIPFAETFVRRWAEREFKSAPNAIVLSHGHFDHVSSAKALADLWNVPIYANFAEIPYLTGKKEYPPPNTEAGGGIMPLLSPLFPRGPVDLGEHLRELPDSSDRRVTIPEMPGWQIIDTPGHTPGHISFFREHDRVLLPGDAFCTTKPESFFEANVTQKAELHGPPSYFTSDWALARSSVEFLASLEPLVVAPGHGQPLIGENLPQSLRELVAHFDQIAVPENRTSAAGS